MKGPLTRFYVLCVCRYEDCEESGHSSAVHGGDACRSAIKLTNKISSKCCCHFSESTVSVSDGYLMRLQCWTLALFKTLVKPLISFYLTDVKTNSYVVLHLSVELMHLKASPLEKPLFMWLFACIWIGFGLKLAIVKHKGIAYLILTDEVFL